MGVRTSGQEPLWIHSRPRCPVVTRVPAVNAVRAGKPAYLICLAEGGHVDLLCAIASLSLSQTELVLHLVPLSKINYLDYETQFELKYHTVKYSLENKN